MGLENGLYAERSRSATERNEQHSMIAEAAFAGAFKDHKDMQQALEEFSEEII